MKSELLTFQEKVIRGFTYAAVCGISLSFAVAAGVNAESHLLHEWKNDPALLPSSMPVLQPYVQIGRLLEKKAWVEDLTSINNRYLGQAVLEAPNMYEEKIVTPSFRKLLIDSEARALAERRKRRLEARKNGDMQLAEIHQMLLNVQQTEAKLVVNKKQKDEISSKAAAPENSTIGMVQGRLLPVGSGVMNGHFEVGLYASVNYLGLPVGYPLTQQILSSGETDFSLKTTATKAYLFARYSSDDAENIELWFHPTENPLVVSSADQMVDIPVHPQQKGIVAPAIVRVAEKDNSIHGHVTAMFARTGQVIAQATVKVRGTEIAVQTNEKGDFTLPMSDEEGPILLEVVKAGYMPSIVRLGQQELRDGVSLELASKAAIDQMASALGIRQSMEKSVFIGRAQGVNGQAISGLTAQLLSLHADGPYYFRKEGFPVADSSQKATGSDGRFIYFNVDSGVGYLEAADQGDAIAPMVFTAVDGGGLIYKALTPLEARMRGRVLNPVAGHGTQNEKPVVGAKVRLAGGTDWVNTDAYGSFDMGVVKVLRNEDFALEMSAEKYYNHRYVFTVSPDSERPLPNGMNLFAFPANYINSMANSVDVALDPYTGVVIGGVGRRSLRIDALAEHTDLNNAKDYYFDGQGTLKGSFAQTDKRFGTYIIFNVPRGRVLLHGLDATGNLHYSGITYTGASTVNVVLQ